VKNKLLPIIILLILVGGIFIITNFFISSETGRKESNIISIEQNNSVIDANIEQEEKQIVKQEPVVEPVPEPVVEPVPEPVVEPVPEPVVEPVPEPVVEPVPEIKEIEVHEGEVIITIENLKYIPNEITVRLGTIITWINKDNSDPLYAEHTVMIDELNAKSPEIVFAGGAKEKWSYTFNEIGEFSYYCSIHPFMKGKIIVVE